MYSRYWLPLLIMLFIVACSMIFICTGDFTIVPQVLQHQADLDHAPYFTLVTPALPRYFYILKYSSLRSLAASVGQIHGLVIAASETDENAAMRLQTELNLLYGDRFGDIIVEWTPNKTSTGENRNRGARRALKDHMSHLPLNKTYIMFVDSDDEYHPQRFSVMEQVILSYDFPMEILHAYVDMNKKKATNWPSAIDLSSIPIVNASTMWSTNRHSDGRQKYPWIDAPTHKVHNGHPSVRADVLLELSYPDRSDAEDSMFNQAVLQKFNNTITISLPLSMYYNRRNPEYEVLV